MKTISRRNFLRKSSLAVAAGLTLGHLPAIASTAAVKQASAGNIPLNKQLDPAWIRSLYKREGPTIYAKSRDELRYIGMPVGGINAGGVYLGGDGRLWLWDIFNDNREGIEPKIVKWKHKANGRDMRSRDGACYLEPAQDIRPLQQGFAIRIEYAGKSVVRYMDAKDWDEILFEAGYPVGVVRYIDSGLPVEITLYAYSPFIPLDEDDSGLPATILSFSVKNNGSATVKVDICGWLENKICIHSADEVRGSFGARVSRRSNRVVKGNGLTGVEASLVVVDERKTEEVQNKPDYGTMCLVAFRNDARGLTAIDPLHTKELFNNQTAETIEKPVQEPLVGAVQSNFTLAGGATETINFAIAWYFPNLKIHERIKDSGRYYQNRFASALEVAQYMQKHFDRLSSTTLLWASTWQDSSLPHWFLERTFLNINTLATSNCHRFNSGRFWAWEGVGACAGTCTHVWQYAQAMGRIFPALERDCRERTELDIAMQEDGGIIFRAEMESRPAIDGQAGTVLRCLREHQMSVDDAFLRRNWTKIKKATQFIINQDKNGDGMEDTPMENTLDAVWDGEIAWIVGLCIAAVKAAQVMAEEMDDKAFANVCATYVKKGSANMDKYLFNGEYYIHRPDKEKGRAKLGSYNTSHIDQVMGQSWAHQVGLGYIQDPKKVKSALRSLWKYNYTPDVGPYIEAHQGGRAYALPGEGGLIMNTNPKNEAKPYGENVTWQLGYFHECMTGFEYQVAAHMIAEGMTDEGLVLVRSIHDRYHAAKRNPYNEIECSDHYARAMASYGAFITACGYEYHGPKGYMRFAPKWGHSSFKAPFTAAEGWGTYEQKQSGSTMECLLEPKYGQVQLNSFSIEAPKGKKFRNVQAFAGGQNIPAKISQQGSTLLITLQKRITIRKGEQFTLACSASSYSIGEKE
ncbi:twin-arginine translocation signal domain-containing protein [Parabacteroides sp. OttesenSCG-928-K15]|nr:twin-arginine translocation signal domain-containing protein [Parabacteroides sp. OttesenSCG-928-K15]